MQLKSNTCNPLQKNGHLIDFEIYNENNEQKKFLNPNFHEAYTYPLSDKDAL